VTTAHLGIAAAVFVTDAVISYMGWQRLDSWLTGRRWRVVIWGAALDVAIAVNVMGFIVAHWTMLVPSVIGSMLGTLLAFRTTAE
jgi:hypothetical protein